MGVAEDVMYNDIQTAHNPAEVLKYLKNAGFTDVTHLQGCVIAGAHQSVCGRGRLAESVDSASRSRVRRRIQSACSGQPTKPLVGLRDREGATTRVDRNLVSLECPRETLRFDAGLPSLIE
jgi:hypothetical protein